MNDSYSDVDNNCDDDGEMLVIMQDRLLSYL